AERSRRVLGSAPAGGDPVEQAEGLARRLLSETGEASGTLLATALCDAFRAMHEDQSRRFLQRLAAGFGPDAETLAAAARAYLADATPATAMRLNEVSEPPRQELLRRMNMAEGGTGTIVRMREQVLTRLRAEPELAPLEADLRHLLGSWFNRGFLQIERIDWSTPAMILEKLIRYEAVHAIRGWDDLRRRLESDRRCFAFFHPALPDEPLIFVEVALTDGIADAVAPLLAPRAERGEDEADTAIFYSISNCQPGLRGISFGNFLIKQVVADLRAELPNLTRFATLSPVPGLVRALRAENDPALAPLFEDPSRVDPSFDEKLRRAAARWLVGQAEDPVARFHLSNGARLERIHARADLSEKGLRESFGVMVNYLYDPGTIEANHETFVARRDVPHGPEVEALLAEPGRRRLFG
ncbi:MAG: Malonyl-CoA decarboxylase, partial [Rhodospirillales bacterium]|nr:Malonyl-CoA decarboxylase [Rhodospirillales bacterium]